MARHCGSAQSSGMVMLVLLAALCLTVFDVTAANQPVSASSIEGSGVDGRCNRGLPPPDHPFKVVWNHPDNCKKRSVPLHLDRYGFTFNRDRKFLGEEIKTMYRTGRWPTISSTGQAINGGVPQLFDYTNLNQTWKDLGAHSDTFKGQAVLDFEDWRAIYTTNFGSMKKYQQHSVALVRNRHPEYSKTMLRRTAEQEWEQAARKLMLIKLVIGQTLKPKGNWGYYNYPRTWKATKTVSQNNKIEWLWRQATGLYPRIYTLGSDLDLAATGSMVTRMMAEAVRIQQAFSPPNTAIYAYSNPQFGNHFYDQDHLRMTLGVSADMGASGVVLWGNSSHYRNPDQCVLMQEHIRTVLGPYVQNLIQFMADCSTALCGGHGRCVSNSRDSLLSQSQSEELSAQCVSGHSAFQDYHCRCYSNWEGPCCQTTKSVPCQGDVTDILNSLLGD